MDVNVIKNSRPIFFLEPESVVLETYAMFARKKSC